MRSIARACFGALLAGSMATAYSQSAEIGFDPMTEADVRSGGKEISIKLSGFGIVFDSFTDDVKRDLINGLSGSTAFELVKSSIPLDNVVRVNNKNATITLAATPLYYITGDDLVTVTVPSSALWIDGPITGSPEVKVDNLNTSITYSGTLMAGADENQIRSGGRNLVLTASYNRWKSSLAGSEVNLVRGMFSQGTFSQEVAAQITATDVTVSGNRLEILLPASDSYFIGEDEEVTLTVDEGLLQDPESLDNSQSTFGIANRNPRVTLQDISLYEADIRASQHTFTVTVAGDRLADPIDATALISGFTGGTGWESLLEPDLQVRRVDDFTAGVTVPSTPDFNIDATEEVSFTMDADLLETTPSGSFSDAVNRVTLIPIEPSLQISSIPEALYSGNLDGATLVVELVESELADPDVDPASLSASPAIGGLTFNAPVNVTETSFEVPLSFDGEITEGQTLTLVLSGKETTTGSDLKSNSLPLSTTFVPIVRYVSIPNQPMGIGDEVTATVIFEPNSEPGTFSYVEGTIEGEPFDEGSLTKIDNVTYIATFTIREGTPNRAPEEAIRVRNLRFAYEGTEGPAYDGSIIQDNDEIDTEVPVISHISYADATGVYGIGDPVTGVVLADGADYEFDFSRSFINEVTFSSDRIGVVNHADNTYSVTYTPGEGDPDVAPGGRMRVALVMIDGVGNASPPDSTLLNNVSPVIDANSPSLDSAVVVNPGVKLAGDPVEILVYSSEALEVPDPPIPGTHVNFVDISSGRVTFSAVSNRVYRLVYTVGTGDNPVEPGELTFNLEMEDRAGNRSNSNIPLKNNDVAIGSNLPTATLLGSGSVCVGDSLQGFLYLTGKSPWDVVISSSRGEIDSLSGITSPYTFWVKPDADEEYTVTSIIDGYGVVGSAYGVLEVTLNQPTPVNILLDRTTFLASEPGVQLRADLEPGIFSGPGVSGGYFYPSIATPVGSPHAIRYTYQNPEGCESTDEIQVEVLEGTGSVVLLNGSDTVSILCDDRGSYQIIGANKEDIPGTFEVRVTNSTTVVEGAVADPDSADNRATLIPSGLNGGYDIVYTYVIDNVTLTASYFFRVDLIEPLQISGTLPGQVCENDAPYVLTGNLDGSDPFATWNFRGPGVYGDMESGFFFDPGGSGAVVGQNEIVYEYTTEGGCTASTSREVDNRFVPEVRFDISTVCIPEDGGMVEFSNQTSGKYAVEKWSWNFGDISSGVDNFSNEESPSHFYSEPGLRSIILTANTFDGCMASFTMDTLVADKPQVDFRLLSECLLSGEDATFLNLSYASFTAIDTLVWTLKTSGGSVLGETGASPGQDTLHVSIPGNGTYGMELYALNRGGCSNTLFREITLKPTVKLQNTMRESFDAAEGGWTIESDDGNESWIWGEPDFNGFAGSPGDRAWYTDLPSGIVGYNENSWIQSPCYDFTGMQRPLIQLDIMRSFVPNLTGAVLQYLVKAEDGWQTLGFYQGGIEWYNTNSIFNRPGGSNYGWGLNLFEPDQEWVTAVHDLDDLAGESRVQFRVIIGTNGQQGIGNQGFAFDNVVIAERTRKSVLEHFTNSADAASRLADDRVDSFFTDHSADVIDLQYHTGFPGFDPMNLNNPEPAAYRLGYLGVGQVPYSVLDGGLHSYQRYDFSVAQQEPNGADLRLSSLEIPPFLIGLSLRWEESSLEVDVSVVCNTPEYPNNVQLYLAVIESEVTAYTGVNGDGVFRNVVLDMLPSPAGSLLGGDWLSGQEVVKNLFWEYSGFVEDPEDLGVVAFIQDRETGKILQAIASHFDSQVGIARPEVAPRQLSVYPNPAGGTLFVNLGESAEYRGRLVVTDISGRPVMEAETGPAEEIRRLDVSRLPAGIYLVSWIEDGRLRGRARMVRTR